MPKLLEEVRHMMPGRARSNWKHQKRQEESVAGAPGAFASTDHPAYLDDQTADLLDRVHNPRWEYPTWALPKTQLDEAKHTFDIYDKAKGGNVAVTVDVAKDGTVKAEGRVVGVVKKDPSERGRWFGESAKGKTISERNTKKSVLRDMAAYSIGVRLLGMPR